MSNINSPDGERTKHGGSADAGLIELERQLAEARETFARFRASVSGYSLEEEPAIEEKAGPLDARVMELERQIARTPARGLLGVGVLLRVAAHCIKEDKGESTEDVAAVSAHEAVERLLKEHEASDAEIISLGAKADALLEEHSALLIAFAKAGKVGVCEEADAPFEQASELVERILNTPAHTPAGIAVKLRIADETDGWEKDTKEQPHRVACAGMSALADLERLSGPFVPPAGDDAELFDLHSEWKRLEGAAEKKDLDTGTENPSDWQAAFAAEDLFLKTPARTLAGVLFKLRLGCLPETYALDHLAEDGTVIAPAAVLAAFADLERLAAAPSRRKASGPPQAESGNFAAEA